MIIVIYCIFGVCKSFLLCYTILVYYKYNIFFVQILLQIFSFFFFLVYVLLGRMTQQGKLL